jgi:hypothetical protein
MDRRRLIVTGLVALAPGVALGQSYPASGQPGGYPPPQGNPPPSSDDYPPPGNQPPPPPPQGPAPTYGADELRQRVSDFLGVTAESAGAVIERTFKDNGRPTAYIAGEEGAGAFFVGLRYGKGLMYMKERPTQRVYWQGPSFGWDFGGNASRVFTLCYNLQYPDAIYQRFPGVEGSAYLVGGLGVNYQRAEDISLAPIRAGLGLRLGANVGYLAYSRGRNIIPL